MGKCVHIRHVITSEFNDNDDEIRREPTAKVTFSKMASLLLILALCAKSEKGLQTLLDVLLQKCLFTLSYPSKQITNHIYDMYLKHKSLS